MCEVYIFTFTVSSLNKILVQLILFVPSGHTYKVTINSYSKKKSSENVSK